MSRRSMNDHWRMARIIPNASIVPFLPPPSVQRIILFRPDVFLLVSVDKASRGRNEARVSLETRFLFTLLRVLFNYNHDEMKR